MHTPRITHEDLVRFILKKENISEKEFFETISKEQKNNVPITIFKTELSPLESITRYLKENLNKKINEIARILNKKPSAISLAYKNSKLKNFKIEKTDIFIPLSEFQDNQKLSILEIVVQHLKNKNLAFSNIAKLLKRNRKTIWTIYSRVKKKKK